MATATATLLDKRDKVVQAQAASASSRSLCHLPFAVSVRLQREPLYTGRENSKKSLKSLKGQKV